MKLRDILPTLYVHQKSLLLLNDEMEDGPYSSAKLTCGCEVCTLAEDTGLMPVIHEALRKAIAESEK